ncbi:MAG: hypothetical protein HY517_00370 [Candidatus Aenigmarchaeota archaeon]|nr:hypothetical protein [Candidatus Aenigmarchaeota archaeon]
MVSANHIPNAGVKVGDPVMIVKGDDFKPGRYRAFSGMTVYVEHYHPPATPDEKWVTEPAAYDRNELDGFYLISEDPSWPKPKPFKFGMEFG